MHSLILKKYFKRLPNKHNSHNKRSQKYPKNSLLLHKFHLLSNNPTALQILLNYPSNSSNQSNPCHHKVLHSLQEAILKRIYLLQAINRHIHTIAVILTMRLTLITTLTSSHLISQVSIIPVTVAARIIIFYITTLNLECRWLLPKE